jgi:hypothetical protein
MYIPFTYQTISGGEATIPNYTWSFSQTLSLGRGVDVWWLTSNGSYDGLTLYNGSGPGTQTLSGTAQSPYTPWIANVSVNFNNGAPQITSTAGAAAFSLGNVVNLRLTLNSFSAFGNTRRYFNLLYTNAAGSGVTTNCFGGANGLGGVGDAADQSGVRIVNPLVETTYTPKISWTAIGCNDGSGNATYGVSPSTY